MSSSSPPLSGVDFVHKGYRYWLARQGESNVFWYCCKRTAGCPARLFTSLKNDRVAEEMHCHDHPPTESTSTNGVVPSTKGSSGGPALAKSGLRHNGYDFHQERTSENGTKAYWVCKQKRSMQCAARVHTLTESGEVVHEFGEHNHAPVDDDATTKASPEPTSEHDPYDSPVANPKSSGQARSAMCHKGYTYWQHSASSDGTRLLLYCKERRSKQCTARLNATATGKVVQVVGQHNHPPSGPVKSSAKEASKNPALDSSTSDNRMRYKNAVYHRDQVSKDGTKRYWFCPYKRTTKCSARIHTCIVSGEVMQEVGKHNHRLTKADGNAAKNEKVVAKAATLASPAQPTIRHKRYDYHREKETADRTKIYWYCKSKGSTKCTARIHTTAGGEVVQEVSEHNHPPTSAVTKKDSGSGQEDTPKTCHPAKRRTLSADREQSSKKRRTSAIVDIKKNSTPSTATASPANSANTSSTFALAQRLMSLPPAKRTSAASLFSSLLDEMESDVKTEH